MDVRPLDPRAPRALPVVAPVPRAGDVPSVARELRGSGLDLGALLGEGADVLVSREAPQAVELHDVLERARGALVRGAPMDVLAALDAGWEGAARTDAGWYFRSAALLLLGLAGEADRVLDQAIDAHPGSSALRFLHSVVRSALGDASGARAALQAVATPDIGHPVLRAWEAVLRARSGDRSGAQALLAEVADETIAAPVLAWARQVVLRSSADAMRDGLAFVVDTTSEPVAPPRLDALEGALHRLGAQLADAPADRLQADVRAMLQALSPAGLLRDAAAPAREQAVRSVLGSLLHLLVERAATPAHGAAAAVFSAAPDSPPVLPWRREVLLALREGRLDDAARELQRGGFRDEAATVTVLRTLAHGAGLPVESHATAPSVAAPRDDGLLGPVRFGLMLLPDPWPVRASGGREVRDGRAAGRHAERRTGEERGDDRTPSDAIGGRVSLRVRLRALLLALAAGAAWLALR